MQMDKPPSSTGSFRVVKFHEACQARLTVLSSLGLKDCKNATAARKQPNKKGRTGLAVSALPPLRTSSDTPHRVMRFSLTGIPQCPSRSSGGHDGRRRNPQELLRNYCPKGGRTKQEHSSIHRPDCVSFPIHLLDDTHCKAKLAIPEACEALSVSSLFLRISRRLPVEASTAKTASSLSPLRKKGS